LASLSVLTVFINYNTCSVMRYMTNHFCALVLFDYPCDMDHEPDSK